ncbi:Rpr2-domain-containing protein [Microthyrium microscopicum]|uniref:Rpr2-domain-containing protein n=1 Tax=Microthyrium microscopicum TaxID=703497 RepID=A0A6A6U2W5_9PEZI|nr:Rpr2-domain-containing protein [Microthyrium microscopicum]
MAKVQQNSKKERKVANKHLHSRVSFLHQAANLVANISASNSEIKSTTRNKNQQFQHPTQCDPDDEPSSHQEPSNSSAPSDETSLKIKNSYALSGYLSSHIITLQRKSNDVKLTREIKRTICKRCNTLLLPGKTSSSKVENKSRGGKKAWADVLVETCLLCGMEKRYPVGAKKQLSKKDRIKIDETNDEELQSSTEINATE